MNRQNAQSQCVSRAAVTLIELLVAIAIIGLLIALTLPAVQYARESARRTSCANKLRQLGIAVISHADAHGHLPISVSPFREGPNPAPRRDGRGWIVAALPYMEQVELRRRFVRHFDEDFLSGQGLKHPDLADTMQMQLPALQCPSDGSVRQLSDKQWQWEDRLVALTSYKGVIGDNRMGGAQSMFQGTEPDCIYTADCNGMIHRNSYQGPLSFADARDGTSNTFLIGEDVPAANYHSVAFYANGDYASCHAPLNFFPDPPRPREWWDVMSFRSRHARGANFTFVDGATRFVAETIDHGLYRALSTRAGRESVSPP